MCCLSPLVVCQVITRVLLETLKEVMSVNQVVECNLHKCDPPSMHKCHLLCVRLYTCALTNTKGGSLVPRPIRKIGEKVLVSTVCALLLRVWLGVLFNKFDGTKGVTHSYSSQSFLRHATYCRWKVYIVLGTWNLLSVIQALHNIMLLRYLTLLLKY